MQALEKAGGAAAKGAGEVMRGASVEGIWGDDSEDEGEAARIDEDAAHVRLAMQRSIEDAKSMEMERGVQEDCFAGGGGSDDGGRDGGAAAAAGGDAPVDAAAAEMMADMGL